MRVRDITPNTLVFSTRAVIYKKEALLYFSLDEENDFQALGPSGADTESAMLVSISQIIDIDNSVLDIQNIEPGQAFIRKSPSSPWELG